MAVRRVKCDHTGDPDHESTDSRRAKGRFANQQTVVILNHTVDALTLGIRSASSSEAWADLKQNSEKEGKKVDSSIECPVDAVAQADTKL